MSRNRFELMCARRLIPAILTSLLLAACGGGGDGGSSTSVAPPPSQTFLAQQATDSFSLFNSLRQQTGLSKLSSNSFVDKAAQGHSNYQALNNTITHTQTAGKSGFTAVNLGDIPDSNGVVVAGRLSVAGYQFPAGSYAYGEVLARTGNTSGVNAAMSWAASPCGSRKQNPPPPNRSACIMFKSNPVLPVPVCPKRATCRRLSVCSSGTLSLVESVPS